MSNPTHHGEINKIIDLPYGGSINSLFQILDVKRFTDLVLTSPSTYKASDIYDVVITDGIYKIKCQSSPSSTPKFRMHTDLKNSIVSAVVEKPRHVKYPIILSFTISGAGSDIDGIPWIDLSYEFYNANRSENTSIEKLNYLLENRPLSPRACTYLHPLCDHIPIGAQWEPKDISLVCDHEADVFTTKDDQFKLISEIKEEFRAKSEQEIISPPKRPKSKNEIPFIVARVLVKSQLSSFSKGNLDGCPFTFSMMVGDYSGTIKVSCWSFVSTLWRSIHVGDLLLIRSFRARRYYKGKIFNHYVDESREFVELALNPAKHSLVYVLKGDILNSDTFKDMCNHKLSTTPGNQVIKKLTEPQSDNHHRNLINFRGQVLYVGKLERLVSFESNSPVLIQWICLRDKSVDCDIFLKFIYDGVTKFEVGKHVLLTNVIPNFISFGNSNRPEEGTLILKGQVITNVSEIQETDEGTTEDRYLFEVLSKYDQLVIPHYKSFYERGSTSREIHRLYEHPDIEALISWAKSEVDLHTTVYTQIRGYVQDIFRIKIPHEPELVMLSHQLDILKLSSKRLKIQPHKLAYVVVIAGKDESSCYSVIVPLIPSIVPPRKILLATDKKYCQSMVKKFFLGDNDYSELDKKASSSESVFLNKIVNRLKSNLSQMSLTVHKDGNGNLQVVLNEIYPSQQDEWLN